MMHWRDATILDAQRLSMKDTASVWDAAALVVVVKAADLTWGVLSGSCAGFKTCRPVREAWSA